MLAFMDSEYNSDMDYEKNRSDQSLIEVTLLITDDHAKKVIESYHRYVMPQLHNGKLYKRIKQMTGIRQNDVDNGISFANAIEDMYLLLKKYEVQKIYVYGGDDVAFRWNKKQYGIVPYGNKFIKCIKDISGSLSQKCGIKNNPSLNTLAYICGTKAHVTHSASDDAETLREVYLNVVNGKFDEEKCTLYKRHASNQEQYYRIRECLRQMEKNGMKREEIFEMLKEEKAFPKFLEDEKK